VIRKSTTADATARNWTLVANGQTLYLFIESGDNRQPRSRRRRSASVTSSRTRRATNTLSCIIGRTAENSGSSVNDPLHAMNHEGNGGTISVLNSSMFGHYIARSWTGLGGSVRFGKPIDISRVVSWESNVVRGSWGGETLTTAQNVNGALVAMGRNASSFVWPSPNGCDGSIALAPVYMCHNWSMRGYLPGLWQPMHDRPCGHNDVLTLTGGNLNGKTLLAQNIQAYISFLANTENGQCLIETSNTWS
jgi:hypothetical protein